MGTGFWYSTPRDHVCTITERLPVAACQHSDSPPIRSQTPICVLYIGHRWCTFSFILLVKPRIPHCYVRYVTKVPSQPTKSIFNLQQYTPLQPCLLLQLVFVLCHRTPKVSWWIFTCFISSVCQPKTPRPSVPDFYDWLYAFSAPGPHFFDKGKK